MSTRTAPVPGPDAREPRAAPAERDGLGDRAPAPEGAPLVAAAAPQGAHSARLDSEAAEGGDAGQNDLPFDVLAAELMRALRGRRSQLGWSRRLGYRSNVAWAWEHGRRWPTAAEAMRACVRAGLDLNDALTRFYGRRPSWLDGHDPTTTAGVAAFLADLKGSASITDLALRSGLSRFSWTRWLTGQTEPRLPDFLRAVEAASLRGVDLLAVLAEPSAMPTVGALHARLDLHRRAAAEAPWLQAVVHGLALDEYQSLGAHRAGWLTARLGLPPGEEDRCLSLLSDAGRIRWRDGRWTPAPGTVDTRPRPEVGRAIKAHWARIGAEYALSGRPGQYSYNVFSCSAADFERIRAAHLDYFRLLRGIVATSAPDEIVAVANVQLFALAPDPGALEWQAPPGRGRRSSPPDRV